MDLVIVNGSSSFIIRPNEIQFCVVISANDDQIAEDSETFVFVARELDIFDSTYIVVTDNDGK